MKAISIMIVENNPDLRSILRHAFEGRGYLTWTCPAPEIAISIFNAVQPSIVILDLDIEEPDPLELMHAWKEMSPETRVIVETSAAHAGRMREAMVHGAHAFLIKPYALDPLFALLEKEIEPVKTCEDTAKKAAA